MTDPERISCGSSRMQRAFYQCVEYYQPVDVTLHGDLEVEAGYTENSMKNIRKFIALYGKPSRVICNFEKPSKWVTLFIWFNKEDHFLTRYKYRNKTGDDLNEPIPMKDRACCFLASGFSGGYGGQGPVGLSKIASECGFGELDDLKKYVCQLPMEFKGEIFPNKVPHTETVDQEIFPLRGRPLADSKE